LAKNVKTSQAQYEKAWNDLFKVSRLAACKKANLQKLMSKANEEAAALASKAAKKKSHFGG